MKSFLLTLFGIVVLSILSFVGYVSYEYLKEKNSVQFSPIVIDQNKPNNNSNLSATSSLILASSTIDTADWKIYENQELGYKVSYPPNLIVNRDERVLILAFDKEDYFSWPLLDSVRLNISATTTCRSFLPKVDKIEFSKLIIDGKEFNQYSRSDIGAGNITIEQIYEIVRDDMCFQFVRLSSGTNGAGFYVDNPVLIKKYDDKHKEQVEIIDQVIYSILHSFELVKTPEGRQE